MSINVFLTKTNFFKFFNFFFNMKNNLHHPSLDNNSHESFQFIHSFWSHSCVVENWKFSFEPTSESLEECCSCSSYFFSFLILEDFFSSEKLNCQRMKQKISLYFAFISLSQQKSCNCWEIFSSFLLRFLLFLHDSRQKASLNIISTFLFHFPEFFRFQIFHCKSR
jgi:hypothetical protein